MSLKTAVDHIVIGAGIVGSCVAWQLQKHGRKVLVLEKFRLPHTRGSSHGQTRMIRSCYEDDHFIKIMPEALELWNELEQETETKLISKSGVWCLSTDGKYMDDVLANMKKYCKDQFSTSSTEEFCTQFPTMKYSKDYRFLFDKTGGIIFANKALSAVQGLFRNRGGMIWDGSAVQSVELNEDSVKVCIADQKSVVAPSLIVCSGAWTSELFQKNNLDLSARLKMHLQPAAVNVYYWKCKEPFEPKNFPSFINHEQDNGKCVSIYGLRPSEYPGMMKVCIHGGVPCKPDEREKASFEEFEKKLKPYVAEHLPGLDPEPSIVEKCMYTVTPDENFVVDYLYEHKNVILGCGFSGTGFKTAPVIAKIIRQMAMGEQPSYDVPEFKLSRFTNTSS